jgi:GNAT superfamily N-acetyltransferase
MRPPAHSSAWLEVATLRDARALAALRSGTAAHLEARFGPGPWAGHGSEQGARRNMANGVVYVRREDGHIVAAFTLSRRKPWAIDPAHFSPAAAPLHLTGMMVEPGRQRSGLGRRCLVELATLARDWKADAVRLDAFEAPAGAGGFYAACGWRETGRVAYRGTRLIYFERRFD